MFVNWFDSVKNLKMDFYIYKKIVKLTPELRKNLNTLPIDKTEWKSFLLFYKQNYFPDYKISDLANFIRDELKIKTVINDGITLNYK